MKRRNLAAIVAGIAGAACGWGVGGAYGQTAVGTSFTYQGELRLSGNPAASADLQFTLWDAPGTGTPPTGGTQIGGMETESNVPITNGRFTVLLNDTNQFGATPFGPDARWIQIAVRSPAGAGAFTTLGPRQRVTGAPNASFALEAQSAVGALSANNAGQLGGQSGAFYTNAANMNAGTLPGARLSGTYGNALSMTNAGNAFAGSGAGLTALNASNLSSGTIGDARLSSNVALRDAVNAFSASGNTFAGFLGIGRNAPVTGADALAVRRTVGPNGYAGMYVDGSDPASWPFYGYATNGTARAYHYLDAATGVWHLVNGGATPLSVTDTGNVGIGVTAPGSRLDIQSASIGPHMSHAHHGANGDWYIRSASSAGNVVLQDSGGRVGVGTASPTSPLHVASGVTDAVRLHGPGQYTTDARLRFQDDFYNVSIHNDIDGGLTINTGSRLALMGSRVGIGTASPGTSLDIRDGGQAMCRMISNSAGNGSVLELGNTTAGTPTFLGAINFSNSVGGVPGQIGYRPGATDQMTFHVGGATRMTVFGNGLTQVKTLQILGGSDLAEPFDVSGAGGNEPGPGHVVVIDPANPGDLVLCGEAYDGKVAGIISGANGLAAGLVLKAEGDPMADGAHAVAMTGRVWCRADASFGAITPGDRLTTSATPGHAMVVGDATRADGAVIGKAMTALPEGRGLVLVLVNLQ